MRTKHALARWAVKSVLALVLLFTVGLQAQSADRAQGPEQVTRWQDLPPHIQAKVDPRILAELSGEIMPTHLAKYGELAPSDKSGPPPPETRFLVFLETQADLEGLRISPQVTAAEQRSTVVDALLATSRATQAPVQAVLDEQMARGAASGYLPFYVFNGFAVQGNLETLIKLALRADVARIAANYPLVHSGLEREPADSKSLASASARVRRDDSLDAADPRAYTAKRSISAANWNIGLVGAERVWNDLSIAGEGAVVASVDTGVDWDHPALRSAYRGTSNGPVDHNYNWFEFSANAPQYWDTGGDYGPSASSAPYDCDDHGTHTMGTIVGDGGQDGTQIGMAPGAKWIAMPGICGRTMPGGYQDDIGGIRTFQWLMCPTDLSGDLATRDCSKAPDVINNSWGSSNPADNTFRPIIRALRAAGIVPIFASGNPSAGLGSIGSPASVPEAIAIGATDRDDLVPAFSGRGPSLYDGVQKPELSAPGVSILSSIPGTQYRAKSGTSMAAPHVTGLVALMVSADLKDGRRDLDVDELLAAMTQTAVDLGPAGPDNEYGYGRIDAFDAVSWVLHAGTLRITVQESNTSTPIARATATLRPTGSSQVYTAQTDAAGSYTFSVPSGTFSLRLEAFGYAVRTVYSVVVNTGQQTIRTVALTPLGTGILSGRVQSEGMPVSGARLYVGAAPERETTSAPDGTYTLHLPVGTHTVTVAAPGYRIARSAIAVTSGSQVQSFDLAQAPTLLLVEADGYKGWYEGRPARQFFQWALDAHNYVYDTAVITDATRLPQLADYDLVIWSHTVGSPGLGSYGTNGVLQDYLDGGGKLILSGQNIGYWDQWRELDAGFYQGYLYSSFFEDDAAQEGDTVSGSHFFSGIQLALNEAAQYSYPNTVTTFSPDSVQPLSGNAYPVLSYDNGHKAAALAIDPCTRPFRIVYLSVGYENLGPRAASRPPEYAELLDRAIQWVVQSKPARDVSVSITPAEHGGTPGSTLRFDLTVTNTGFVADAYDLSLSGPQWPTRLLNGTTEVAYTAEIAPCGSVELAIEVDIPASASPDDQDRFVIKAVSRSEPTVRNQVEGQTTVLAAWQSVAPMPTLRYRLASASLPGSVHYYAIGGFGGPDRDVATDANERYDACSNQWQEMAPMPTPRGNVAAAAIGAKIYVAGGYAGTLQLDVLEIYDVAGDRWATGAALPEPISGAAAAASNGKLYLFGGTRRDGTVSAKTYIYNPATNRWTEGTPMPGGARAFAAAAALNDKIYVAGGWYVGKVEVYDPATDSWSQAASLNHARQSPGMTAAPDGRLYLSGGGDDWWAGLRITERYDPSEDRWQLLDSLSDYNRAGTAVTYVDGRIFCVGGIDDQLSELHESLRLGHSFCDSNKGLAPETGDPVRPGDRVTFAIELHSSMTSIANARVQDPIPEGTTFAGFGTNAAGATYNAAQNRIEWQGSLAAGTPPQQFTYAVSINPAGWDHGDAFVNRAFFDNGAGQLFTRAVTVGVDFADPYPSTKSVSHELSRPGETLTYTLHIENASLVSDVFSLVDPIPDHTSYLPNSLTFGSGQGRYDAARNQISWSGILPIIESQEVVGYRWGDSTGGGTIPGVAFAWQSMSNATDANVNADDGVFGPFPIGFAFGFYGVPYDAFYVSPNGWVGFEKSSGPGIVSCTDYGGSGLPDTFIGGFGGDRAVLSGDGGSIAYKLIGSKPNRVLVVQFTKMRYFYNQAADLADMQILMHEGSHKVLIQYQNLTDSPTASHTGLEGPATNRSFVSYQDRCPSLVQNRLAILFEPIVMLHYQRSTEVSFAVTTDRALANYTWITNTATISSRLNAVVPSASTLVNPVDLTSSIIAADKLFAVPGETVTYDLLLQNTGRLSARGVTLIDPIPQHTAYVPGSLSCSSGTCSYTSQDNEIHWSGDIAQGGQVTLSFSTILASVDQDATPIVNEATLREETGQAHKLQAVFVARTSDLSKSSKSATPRAIGYGGVLTYTIQVMNSGPVDTAAILRDRLPVELAYVPDSVWCASGACAQTEGTITWQGTVQGEQSVPVQFQVVVPDDSYSGAWLINTAFITDTNRGIVYPVVSQVRIGSPQGPWALYLPLILHTR